jgi:hypothetical protein
VSLVVSLKEPHRRQGSAWPAHLCRRISVKHLAALFVLAGALLAAMPVHAENWHKRLTPKRTADEMCRFAIKTEPIKTAQSLDDKDQKGDFLEFHVTVTPKGGPLHKELHCSGEIRIFDGKDFISSSKVQMSETEGVLSFSFKVAARYSEKSGFIFAATDREGQGAHYWFYLKDFVPSK